MGTLYLIRHGRASYGEADYDRLSPRGIEQALAIGRWAVRANLGALFAGPLRRQQQTAYHANDGAAGTLPPAEGRSGSGVASGSVDTGKS